MGTLAGLEISGLGAFIGGVLTLLSPCAAMLLPAFFAYAFASRKQILLRSLVFLLGLFTTLVPLGAFAGHLGGNFWDAHREELLLVAAVLLIIFGTWQLLGISVPNPWKKVKNKAENRGLNKRASAWSVYVLGVVYGASGVCAGPILGSVLTVAVVQGDPLQGGLLMAFYALGMGLPTLILALLWDWFNLGGRKWLRPRPLDIGPIHTTWTNVIAGGLFIVFGVFLLIGGGDILTGSLAGVSASQQARLESQVQHATAGFSTGAFLLILAAIAVLVGYLVYLRSRRNK